jgi:hypothetical protein
LLLAVAWFKSIRLTPLAPARSGSRTSTGEHDRVVARWDQDSVTVVDQCGEVDLGADPVGCDPRPKAAGGGNRVADTRSGRKVVHARVGHRAGDIHDDLARGGETRADGEVAGLGCGADGGSPGHTTDRDHDGERGEDRGAREANDDPGRDGELPRGQAVRRR